MLWEENNQQQDGVIHWSRFFSNNSIVKNVLFILYHRNLSTTAVYWWKTGIFLSIYSCIEYYWTLQKNVSCSTINSYTINSDFLTRPFPRPLLSWCSREKKIQLVTMRTSQCVCVKTTQHACSVKAFRKMATYLHWCFTAALLKWCVFCGCVGDFQARNFMRDMKVGQQAFFYHSNCKEPGIAGIIKVSVAMQKIQK